MNELTDQRQLRSSEQRETRHTDSIALIEEARAAFLDESDEVVEHDTQLFDDNVRVGSSRDDKRAFAARNDTATTPETAERPGREVIHRFTKRDNDPAKSPRRIVTLGDARRGRPKREHGADPPV